MEVQRLDLHVQNLNLHLTLLQMLGPQISQSSPRKIQKKHREALYTFGLKSSQTNNSF